jgi:hypothetical protein
MTSGGVDAGSTNARAMSQLFRLRSLEMPHRPSDETARIRNSLLERRLWRPGFEPTTKGGSELAVRIGRSRRMVPMCNLPRIDLARTEYDSPRAMRRSPSGNLIGHRASDRRPVSGHYRKPEGSLALEPLRSPSAAAAGAAAAQVLHLRGSQEERQGVLVPSPTVGISGRGTIRRDRHSRA